MKYSFNVSIIYQKRKFTGTRASMVAMDVLWGIPAISSKSKFRLDNTSPKRVPLICKPPQPLPKQINVTSFNISNAQPPFIWQTNCTSLKQMFFPKKIPNQLFNFKHNTLRSPKKQQVICGQIRKDSPNKYIPPSLDKLFFHPYILSETFSIRGSQKRGNFESPPSGYFQILNWKVYTLTAN